MSRLQDGFEPVIAALQTGANTYFGAAGATIEPVRRVDGPYSSVLRVRIGAGAAASHAYIKVMKPRDSSPEELARLGRFLEREHRSTAAFHRALGADPELGAVRPIAWFPEHHAIVTAEVPGRPLAEILERSQEPSARLLETARRVGAWVRAYQRSADPAGVVLLAERRSYIDDRLRLVEGRVLSAADRRSILAEFDRLARAIGESVPAVPIHADLTPANVIVGDDGRVTALDLTMAKTGTAMLDLGHLYFHLALGAARHRARAHVYEAVQDAMLRGYDPALTPADPLFELMLWQHGVCHVAMLAERRFPVVGAAYDWFIRRRWQVCARIARTAPGRRQTVSRAEA